MRSGSFAVGLALLLTARLEASVFEVGPSASYHSIQTAIDDAILNGGDNEIRIETGTYTENLTISSAMTSGSLSLVGGWDSGFASRTLDPTATLLDGDGVGRVIDIENSGGSVAIEGVRIAGGSSDEDGAGLLLNSTNSVSFRLENCLIDMNHAANASLVLVGGGAYLVGRNSIAIDLVDVRITQNDITGKGGQGGGLAINAFGSSKVTIRRTSVDLNTIDIDAGDGAVGAGLTISLSASAQLEVDDLVLLDNLITGSTIYGNRGSGGSIGLLGTSTATLRRLSVRDNFDETTGSANQFHLETFEDASAELSDSLVAGGDHDGAELWSAGASTIHATNLTVAGAAGRGLVLLADVMGATSVSNSIAYDNGTNLDADAETSLSTNLVGVDPLFVSPETGDYHLQMLSPAVESGTAAVPGGLGPKELGGGPRVNGTVDQGAYEYGAIFADGFEFGDPSDWSD